MNLEFSFEQTPVIFTQKKLLGEKKIIHERAIVRAQRYLVAESELLESIIEADKSKLYEDFGLSYLTPYCVKHLGLSEDVAANFVRVARKTYEVPELKTAIEEGRLTVTKAKTIVSVINSDNQKTWINKAKTLSKSSLEKAIAYESPKSIKPEKAKLQGPDRVRYEFDLTEGDSELFKRVQNILCQKKGKSMNLAETQVELLECFLDRHDPIRKAQRRKPKVEKLQKIQKLSQGISQEQSSQVQSQDPSRDRSKAQPQKKKVLAPPSKRPYIPAAVIHAANLRDQGKCQARLPDGSLCLETKWVHFHHVIPKAKGGKDSIENLITLCSAHHRLWHARE